ICSTNGFAEQLRIQHRKNRIPCRHRLCLTSLNAIRPTYRLKFPRIAPSTRWTVCRLPPLLSTPPRLARIPSLSQVSRLTRSRSQTKSRSTRESSTPTITSSKRNLLEKRSLVRLFLRDLLKQGKEVASPDPFRTNPNSAPTT